MLTDSWYGKNFLSALDSNLALARIFVVILFFENYLIYFQGTSLFLVTLDFNNVALHPFVSFFFFIAITRIIWACSYFAWLWIKPNVFKWYSKSSDSPISSKVAFTTFLLLLLVSWYFITLERNTSFYPISEENHFFLNLVFKSILLLVLIGCAFITFMTEVDFAKKEDKKVAYKQKSPA